MQLEQILQADIAKALTTLYNVNDTPVLQPTKKEFEGNYTFVVFGLVKSLKKSPAELGKAIGDFLIENSEIIENYNVIQGFLNLKLNNSVWLSAFKSICLDQNWGKLTPNNQKIMFEFSSPNTNKPLHLGHLRNNFLGDSVSLIFKQAGFDVTKTCLVNDRGIHICKSMLAYQKFGNNETPESTGMKGDHLVGHYYVQFDKVYKTEIQALVAEGVKEDDAKKKAPIMQEASDMLLKWENGDPVVNELWLKMNQWVYDGFGKTYQTLGINFDKTYYESNTYLLGKEVVDEGLATGVFFKKQDNSVWIDLKEEKLDEKLVLRGDGTSVYITQDLGTTDLKFADFSSKRSVWVVGEEQDYHFKVLFSIMQKLGRDYANGCFHLSYGMVELPSGKMKSREGTVVDADDLVQEMIETAKTRTLELGKVDEFNEAEKVKLYHTLAMGALKYFLLKVDPKKKMMFNPEESIDFQGNTGPFIQYTYARSRSIVRRGQELGLKLDSINEQETVAIENDIIYLLSQYPKALQEAVNGYSPATITNYVYDLAKTYNTFYNEVKILKADSEEQIKLRVKLSDKVGETIKICMGLLGIDVPERM